MYPVRFFLYHLHLYPRPPPRPPPLAEKQGKQMAEEHKQEEMWEKSGVKITRSTYAYAQVGPTRENVTKIRTS